MSLAKLVAGCVLPLAGVAAFLIFNFYENEQAQLSSNAISRARAMVMAVDRGFASTQASLLALSTSKRLEGGDFEGFHLRAFEALQNMHADSILVVGLDGQVLMSTNRRFGEPLPKLTSTPLLERVLQTERPAVSDLFLGPISGQLMFSVGVPVEHNGKIISMLAAPTLPNQLTKILTEQNFPDSWRAFLTDSSGTVVARTHDIGQYLGKQVAPGLLGKMRVAGEGRYEAAMQQGAPVMTVYSRSPVSGWMIVIGMPFDEITSGLRRTLAWLIAATFAALSIGGYFAWRVGGRIASSITLLGGSAKVLGMGGEPAIPKLHFMEAIELGDVLLEAADNLRRAQFEAHHDALTGLPNRALFRVVVGQQLAICQRNDTRLAILYFDLDGFKAVNDTFGHAVGDQLLCTAAARIEASIRDSDIAARLGGDEFAVALVQADLASAFAFAGKLLDIVAAPYRFGEVEALVSASIGVAGFPDSATEIDTLLAKADRAMYDAKNAGKNRCAVAGQRAARAADGEPV